MKTNVYVFPSQSVTDLHATMDLEFYADYDKVNARMSAKKKVRSLQEIS